MNSERIRKPKEFSLPRPSTITICRCCGELIPKNDKAANQHVCERCEFLVSNLEPENDPLASLFCQVACEKCGSNDTVLEQVGGEAYGCLACGWWRPYTFPLLEQLLREINERKRV